MKNLDVRKENIKKAGAMVLVGIKLMMPAASFAESANAKSDAPQAPVGFTLVQQEDRENNQTLTVKGFEELVGRSYAYAVRFFDYPHMQQDIQNLVYLMNYLYMNELDGTEEKLIQAGYVKPVNASEGMFESIISANSFLNVAANYNQSIVRKTNDPSQLFDLGVFCYDEGDRQIISEANSLWMNTHLNGTFEEIAVDSNDNVINPMEAENSNMYQLFKLLTTLNTASGKRNFADLQPGARFAGLLFYGNNFMQVIRDYLTAHYSIDEISRYFDKAELVRKQWVRNDRETDKCTLLGWLVDMYTETQVVCLERCLNDLLKSFEDKCGKSNVMDIVPYVMVCAKNIARTLGVSEENCKPLLAKHFNNYLLHAMGMDNTLEAVKNRRI